MPSNYINTRGAIALVDDSDSFLDVIKLGFPSDRVVYTFSNPAEAVEPLVRANGVLQREEAKLSAILNSDDPVAALRDALEWIRDDSRQQNIETAFIDYNMPGMNGLELLRQISQPRLMRVLLTGQGTTDEAVEAFNQGLIDVYMPKKDGLASQLREVSERGETRHRNLLWHRLQPAVDSVIKQPAGWQAISEIMSKYKVREYLLLPAPCGYVCRTKDGNVGWLQIDTDESMHGCVEVLQDKGWDEASLENIRSKKATVPIELIDLQLPSQTIPDPISPVKVISEQPWVGAAYFKV